MDTIGSYGDGMAYDPNKKTFPIIGSTTQHFLADEGSSTPSKTMESLASNSKSSVELPKLFASKEEAASVIGREQDSVLKPSLPKVRRSRYSRAGPKPDPDRDEIAERFQTKAPLPYQTSNFRSSTVMKSVTIKKRQSPFHSTKPLPSPLNRKRIVPVHTEPFLWSRIQQSDGSFTLESQSLPAKFLAEEERLFQVRGHKRKHITPIHRKTYNDLHIGGKAPQLCTKMDYKDEADKLRHMALPTEAQELYFGRGINLPGSHSTVVRKKRWQEKLDGQAVLPGSAPTGHDPPEAVRERRQSVTAPTGLKHRSERQPKSETHVPSMVQKSQTNPKIMRKASHHEDSGISASEMSSIRGTRTEHRSMDDRGQRSHPRRTSVDTKNSERSQKSGGDRHKEGSMVKTTQKDRKKPVQEESVKSTKPQQRTEDDTKPDDDGKMDTEEEEEEPEIAIAITEDQAGLDASQDVNENAEISADRPDSEMDIDEPLEGTPNLRPVTRTSITPTPKPPSPNPLMSADLHLNISAEKRDELAIKFLKLDGDKDGHITFRELETTFPQNLSKAQQRYIQEAYELVSSTTFFGLEEFVTVSCLCDRLAKMSGPTRDAFESLNLSTLQQSMTHFVVLFSTVDRQQTGSISIDSFKELLSMALEKDLDSSSRLFDDIIAGIGKDGSSSLDKVEYLVFIPYFLSYK